MQRTATHRNALQRTATHCNTLQHTASQICPGAILGALFVVGGFPLAPGKEKRLKKSHKSAR